MLKGIIAAIKKGDEEFSKVYKTTTDFDSQFYDISDSEGWFPIHYAVNYRNKKAVKYLIDADANMDVTAKDGMTPLMLCMIRKEFEILKIIVESGKANLNKLTAKGSVLHFAAESKNQQMILYLLSKGADPFIENY